MIEIKDEYTKGSRNLDVELRHEPWLLTKRALQPECLDLDHIKEKSKSAYSLTKISQEDNIAQSHRLKN